LSAQEGGKGCWLGYVTHSNPKGKLPSWVINRLASGYAPRLVKRLHKACLEYPEWKAKHSPNLKYWINPEQIASTPKIDLNDVRIFALLNFNSQLSESELTVLST
jgi:hypothetical protein